MLTTNLQTLFQSEQECVAYLFRKRWPQGFVCPFCGQQQPEMLPAYTMVCRNCRKQTSITAHTVMHGSHNSLISWMLVCWQFCSRNQGISAREIQKMLELSSYQTAWRWLQKIRKAAALAEASPCSGTLLLDIRPIFHLPPGNQGSPNVIITLERSKSEGTSGRIKFFLLPGDVHCDPALILPRLVQPGSRLLLCSSAARHCSTSTNKMADVAQEEIMSKIVDETISWLGTIYRKAVDICYLQSYLDEFAFRFNTASWSNRLTVFEHLLTGLLTPTDTGHNAPACRDNHLHPTFYPGGQL